MITEKRIKFKNDEVIFKTDCDVSYNDNTYNFGHIIFHNKGIYLIINCEGNPFKDEFNNLVLGKIYNDFVIDQFRFEAKIDNDIMIGCTISDGEGRFRIDWTVEDVMNSNESLRPLPVYQFNMALIGGAIKRSFNSK